MSQIIRAPLVSPCFHGISWKVSGSGIATMSDSSIALKPVIEEPSNPIPSSSASSTSLGVIAKLLRWPSRSENQSKTNSTPSFSILPRTCFRDSSPDGVDCRRGDIAVREDIDRVGQVDAIVNFAAETHVDRSILGPEEFIRTDVVGTLALVQAAGKLSARLLQVSTDEVYGDVEPGW